MSAHQEGDFRERFSATCRNARRTLLSWRGEHGHWEGELSSSALSTATAIIALESFLIDSNQPTSAFRELPREMRETIEQQIAAGRAWLVQHQNGDGGWGDTTISLTNISTTALVWAALNVRFPAEGKPQPSHRSDELAAAVDRCEAWIASQVGSLQPGALSAAITARYGKDKTFSVPILTALALTGRLGSPDDAWRWIPQLPFELAAFPHRWFALLQLPVVSYALPALIAMGQVRHLKRPTWNPLMRWFRQLVWHRTQRVLVEIQPSTGGFLEATPLTSFVLMTLLGARSEPREVIQSGVDFLMRSVRPDGSWPIDTNLATWTTTLALNALAKFPDADDSEHAVEGQDRSWTKRDRERAASWVLQQQYRVEHPFTHARPGGWAWTDLAGGVPDADDTSGALLALRTRATGSETEAAWQGVKWLLDLQNGDGGIPTFCKGWGALPFDRSSTDITAHAIRAWLSWYDAFDAPAQQRMARAIRRACDYLHSNQQPSGAWAPLWFGNQHAQPEENRLYGTSRVLLACSSLARHPAFAALLPARTERGFEWMLGVQNADGGWGGDAGIASSIEETALAVESLCEGANWIAARQPQWQSKLHSAIVAGLEFLIHATDAGRDFPASPIGFYFAKLWYHEKMYPLVYTLSALGSASALGAAAASASADRLGGIPDAFAQRARTS